MKTPARDESPSLVSRILGALMAFIFLAGTSLFVLLALSRRHSLSGRRLHWFLEDWEFNIFFLWIGLVATVAMIIGFIHGVSGVLDIFNLIWKTGESYDKDVIETADLFKKLALIAAIVPFVMAIIITVLR